MEPTSLPEVELSKKLIHLVKERPYLYNKDLEDYRDEVKKSEGWSAVAGALGLGVEDAQMRWARLRIDFGRHRRKRQAAEACGSQIRDWPLYGLLTWLAPHVKMRAKREKRKREKHLDAVGYKPILPRPEWYVNMHGGVSVEVNPDMVMQNGHEDITESFIVSPDTADYDDDASLENSVGHHHVKKESETAQDHSYSSSSHAADSRTGHFPYSKEENEDNLFCRSICASMQRFSYQQKALAKIRIQQVMYEVEFEHADAVSQGHNGN